MCHMAHICDIYCLIPFGSRRGRGRGPALRLYRLGAEGRWFSGPLSNGTHQTAFPNEPVARFIADSSPRVRVSALDAGACLSFPSPEPFPPLASLPSVLLHSTPGRSISAIPYALVPSKTWHEKSSTWEGPTARYDRGIMGWWSEASWVGAERSRNLSRSWSNSAGGWRT